MESKKKTMRTAFVAPGKSLTVRLGIAQPGARVSPADLIPAKEEDQIALYLKLIKKKVLVEKDEDLEIEKQSARVGVQSCPIALPGNIDDITVIKQP